MGVDVLDQKMDKDSACNSQLCINPKEGESDNLGIHGEKK